MRIWLKSALKMVEDRVVDSGGRVQRLRGFLGEKVDSGFGYSQGVPLRNGCDGTVGQQKRDQLGLQETWQATAIPFLGPAIYPK